MLKILGTTRTVYKEIKALAQAFFWTRSVKLHSKARSNLKGDYFMGDTIIKCIKKCDSSIQIKNVFEVGSNFADGSELLRKMFNLRRSDVHVFEAHPLIFSEIDKLYPGFNTNNLAVFNIEKELEFNLSSEDAGYSSILNKNKKYNTSGYKSTAKVKSVRLDHYLKKNDINSIDLLKVDAEGCGYEVLDGLGERLKDVSFIYIELEDFEYWDGQKTFLDTLNLLKNTHSLVFLNRVCLTGCQTDSLWIRSDFLVDKK